MDSHRDHGDPVLGPSGACALAALLSGRVDVGPRVGVLLSGGDVDTARFRDLVGLDPASVGLSPRTLGA